MTIQFTTQFQRAQVCRHSFGTPGGAFFRALFLADVHLGPLFPEKCLDRLLEQAKELNPDLVLLGGDYAESLEGEARFFERLTNMLQPPMGIYAVPGNNDLEQFEQHDAKHWADFVRPYVVTPLVNESIRVSCGEEQIYLGGLDDWKRGGPGGTLFEEAQENELCLLMMHHPRLAYTHLRNCVRKPDLVLSGHTHGGQISLFGRTVYSFGKYESQGLPHPMRLVSGLYRVCGVPVLVSNGIGASKLPIRIHVPPQIHLISFGKEGQ